MGAVISRSFFRNISPKVVVVGNQNENWGNRKKMCVTSIISGTKVFLDKFFRSKVRLTVCNFCTLAVRSSPNRNGTSNFEPCGGCVRNQHRTLHKIAKLSRCCDKIPDLSRKPVVFFPPNRLPTIIAIYFCSINHHKPTTFCFHGNIFL